MATCNAVTDIFQIASIMNGIAIGFVGFFTPKWVKIKTNYHNKLVKKVFIKMNDFCPICRNIESPTLNDTLYFLFVL